ncbi:hypothetical protein LEP1GSC055_3801 [Leptospira borgpetersenii str. Brem 307]|uniref:Uncharacterized protein n=1 Tax=Leptospira borgpetersenii str. Brem 328 TaxID=1049780 RepID=A0ABC9SJC8_LEPBO|nr:hypothetical protein LEP1GSC055_3801 [Leptospira borgpetersenii str. Brem 307]EMN17767.1 hypothetical protein LEP1GSC056_2870 [Leptospira borgpetersenii str. Brem 328]
MICGNSHALLRAYEMIVLISFQVLGQVLIRKSYGMGIY